MANTEGEKNLSASAPQELVDAFWATVPKGFKNKHVLAAAADIWINIPADLRLAVLSEKLQGMDIKDLIRRIVQEELGENKKVPQTAMADTKQTSDLVGYIKKLSLAEQGYQTDIKVLSKDDARMLSELRAILGVGKHKTNEKTSAG